MKKKLGVEPLIHEGARLTDCTLGHYVEIGAGSVLLETEFGDYSYCARFADIAYTRIGRFSNIASFVRINPGNHPTWRASQHHFMYRAAQYFDGVEDEAEFFQWRRDQACEIG
ncbi:MAG: chloramphenicol acetyltransferase, partial [Rubricella sp.]